MHICTDTIPHGQRGKKKKKRKKKKYQTGGYKKKEEQEEKSKIGISLCVRYRP